MSRRLFPCVCCLTENSVTVRLDKKGRPYSFCMMCQSRTFMKSWSATRGLMYLAPQMISELHAKMQREGMTFEQMDSSARSLVQGLAAEEAKADVG